MPHSVASHMGLHCDCIDCSFCLNKGKYLNVFFERKFEFNCF